MRGRWVLGGMAVFLVSGGARAQTPALMKYRVLVADEGNAKIHYVNLANPAEKWSVSTTNRDLQLIGEDRFMASTGNGYAEYDLKTGAQRKKVPLSGGTVQSAFRLTRKSLYVGVEAATPYIEEIDSTGKQLRKINLQAGSSLRLVRPTLKKTFFIGGRSAGIMYEIDSTGKVVWQANAGGEPYMALRLSDGNTLISTGYGAQMALADAQGKILRKFPTAADINGSSFWTQAMPYFFAGFHVMKNGNIVVANWENHGGGNGGAGYQLLEFDAGLTKVVSYWKQDASLISSLHGVLVLDELDTRQMYSDVNGSPVPIINDVPVALAAGPGRHAERSARAWMPALRWETGTGWIDARGRRQAYRNSSRTEPFR